MSDTEAEFTWTNPTQTITPTHTQVRLLNPASLWATVDYPITGIVWGGLDPSTDYEFQVRLIRQVDGVVTHYSPSRSVEFTTDATTVPDWDGEDVDFPEPDGGCTLEWELQSSADGGATVAGTVDDGTISTPPWTIAGYDTSGLDNDLMYRFRVREMCPAAGAWIYGDWFTVGCLDVPAVAVPPFDDAVAYWPQICPPDVVREAISDEEATHGMAFAGFSTDDDGNATLVTAAIEGAVVYGVGPAVVDALTEDTSIVWEGVLGAQPDGSISLAHFAGMWIEATVDGAGWAPTGNALELVGGITTIAGSTTLDLDTFYRVALTHDAAAGDLILYIDAAEEADALGSVGERSNSGIWQIDLPADSWFTKVGVWDRVLAQSELPGYSEPTVTINQAGGQADPVTDGSDVVFTAVFSEAVSGFTSADVTLSGTAGATTAVVTGAGPSYTVTVSGMTGAGTVIATIAATVCVSVAQGAPNQASSSTDNTVTWSDVFDPESVTGLAGWFDAADTSTITASSGRLTVWANKAAANVIHPFGARHPGTDSPATGSRSHNGLNVIDFIPPDWLDMETPSVPPAWFTLGTNTVFLVFQTDANPASNPRLISEYHHTDPDTQYGIKLLSTGVLNMYYEQDSGTVRFNTNGDTPSTGTPHLLTWKDGGSGGAVTMGLDQDATPTTVATYTRGTTSPTRFTVGGPNFNGFIAEILFYDSVLGSTDTANVEQYLIDKWNL